MSLERKAPGVWFIAAVFAAATAGCALENGAPDEQAATGAADLQAAPRADEVPQAAVTLVGGQAEARAAERQTPPVQPLAHESAPVMLTGTLVPSLDETKDDPRPHPWDPTPNGGTTQDGTSGDQAPTGTTSNGK